MRRQYSGVRHHISSQHTVAHVKYDVGFLIVMDRARNYLSVGNLAMVLRSRTSVTEVITSLPFSFCEWIDSSVTRSISQAVVPPARVPAHSQMRLFGRKARMTSSTAIPGF